MNITEHKTAIAITIILHKLQEKYGKRFCYPTQKKLLHLLAEYHRITICRRTLCYVLAQMQKEGYIYRIKRHRVEPIKGMTFRSTAYYLLAKVSSIAKRVLVWAKNLKPLYRVQGIAHYYRNNKDNLRQISYLSTG